MPNDKQASKELKVTDKRIFTPEGDIRDEFKGDIRPADPQAARPPEPPPAEPNPAQAPPNAGQAPPNAAQAPSEDRRQPSGKTERRAPSEERRRTLADTAANPNTPFTNFIEQLIAQAYMSLGMLRNPYQPQPKIDAAAARQMIDILQLLQEKTAGNLDPDEEAFLETHLGELKLAYVQRTKSI